MTLSQFRRTAVDGVSPGLAARELGISRQAIHNAINRDTLEAYRVTDRGDLVAILIPWDAIERYRRQHLRQRA